MKKPNKSFINTNEELQNLVSFIKATWYFPPSFSDADIFDFVQTPFLAGLNITKNVYFNELSKLVESKLTAPHNKFMVSQFQEFSPFDGFLFTVSNLLRGAKSIENELTHDDFAPVFKKEHKHAINLNDSNLIVPLSHTDNRSYQSIRADFNDHDDLGYWDKTDNGLTISEIRQNLFNGHDFHGLRSSGLVHSTAIHNILQSDVNQGRKPLRELITAIIAHASYLQEHNNIAELRPVIQSIEIPVAFTKHEFELPEHPYFARCMKTKKIFTPIREEQEQLIIKHRNNPDSLSDNEKKEIQELEMMEKVRSIKDIINKMSL